MARWQFYASRVAPIYLQVWRKISRARSYRLVHQTMYTQTKVGINTVPPTEQIQVDRGDVLGLYFPRRGVIPFRGVSCKDNTYMGLYVRNPSQHNVRPGLDATFRPIQRSWTACRKYAFSVIILKSGECIFIIYKHEYLYIVYLFNMYTHGASWKLPPPPPSQSAIIS